MSTYSKYLSGLKAPLGVYSVLGNHDSYYGREKIRKMLADAGIPVIENSNLEIKTPKGNFHLAGNRRRNNPKLFLPSDLCGNSQRRARRVHVAHARRFQGNSARGELYAVGAHARRAGAPAARNTPSKERKVRARRGRGALPKGRKNVVHNARLGHKPHTRALHVHTRNHQSPQSARRDLRRGVIFR